MGNKPSALYRLYRMTCCRLMLLLFICFSPRISAQPGSYNFRHVTTSDGLENGVIRGIAQDKYGYTWIGTLNGLCRYNGYSVKVFLHGDNDPYSIPDNYVQGLICDQNKDLWIFFQTGIYHYDYSSGRFNLVPASKGISIRRMKAGPPGTIYCVTSNGLAIFHPSTGELFFPVTKAKGPAKELLQRYLADLCITSKGLVYLGTDIGLVIYRPVSGEATHVPVKFLEGSGIERLALDSKENIWMSFGTDGGSILRIDPAFSDYTLFPQFKLDIPNNRVTNFFRDSRNRLWIGTSVTGLCLYDSLANNILRFGNNPLQPMSISSFLITDIFEDKQGFIWAGTEGYGVNYFHPDDNLFHSILPDYNSTQRFTDNWSRAVAEDRNGNLWLGSINGVAHYNTSALTYTVSKNNRRNINQVYSNSIRSLLYDDHGYLWIGTSGGLNRYKPANGHMDFFGSNDSLPYSFFWSLMQDHNKNIWIGCRDGLYRFSYVTNKFEHFEKDPVLSQVSKYNILSIFEDSRHNMWFGSYKKGLFRYNPETGILKHWMKDDADSSFINNNIRAFAEDQHGMIWIASNDGLASYDPVTGKFKKFRKEEGLKTLNTSELMVDGRNRLWIGTGKGLFVLDSARTHFRPFLLKDGLPSLEFNEQAAFKTSSGKFIYPALKGFLVFDPLEYKEKIPVVDLYISGLKVFNKDYAIATNIEEVKKLRLDYDKNFFSLELTALNYANPEETWYAYKLEPFNKDWIYTKERMVNYTNVPGGDYVFHYKASADDNNWNVEEKTIAIHVGTVFYKTTWFLILLALVASAAIYTVYRYRIAQKEKIYSLQNKAQALEKEKAIVQYESLKQQLNPHFLFNSLTSLRSLIRIDKQNAADFLDKMSLNYRYILKSSESELVPLKDELAFARGYCDLQQTRFGEGLKVVIDVDEEQLYKKIVPVTIQNMIENAIKHNLIDLDMPLLVEITAADNYLLIRNNLQPRDLVDSSNRYGLKHLELLYRHLDTRPVIIEKNEKNFIVKIPLI